MVTLIMDEFRSSLLLHSVINDRGVLDPHCSRLTHQRSVVAPFGCCVI